MKRVNRMHNHLCLFAEEAQQKAAASRSQRGKPLHPSPSHHHQHPELTTTPRTSKQQLEQKASQVSISASSPIMLHSSQHLGVEAGTTAAWHQQQQVQYKTRHLANLIASSPCDRAQPCVTGGSCLGVKGVWLACPCCPCPWVQAVVPILRTGGQMRRRL